MGCRPVNFDCPSEFGCTVFDPSHLSFRVWVPHADNVRVTLTCNQNKYDVDLKRQEEEWFCHIETDLPLEKCTYHYEIYSNWNDCYTDEGLVLHRRDPYARLTDFDSSECHVPYWLMESTGSPFKDIAPYSIPQPEKWILYEMHCGTFAFPEEGDHFDAIRGKLEYLKSLNFNAIEFMPVQEFGGSWGYNPRLPAAIHGKFGTPHSLRSLVDRCHAMGIAVIFDLVLNHGSVKMNSLWNYDGYGPNTNGGIYFEGGVETGWGRHFNFNSPHVQRLLKDTVRIFIEEYRADGIRLDSVHNMPWWYLKHMIREMKENFKATFFIAEVTPENPRMCSDVGFQSVWVHSNYYDAVKILKQGRSEHEMKLLTNILNGHGGFQTGSQMVSSVLGSHDQVGNRHNGHSEDSRIGRYMIDLLGGRDNWHGRAQCRMLYSLQAFSRQMPMIFQGQEILQPLWWNHDIPFKWKLLKDQYSIQFISLVTDANKLRLANKELACSKDEVNFVHLDHSNFVLGGTRGNRFLIVVNFSESQWFNYDIRTPWINHEITQVFSSQCEKYGGWEGAMLELNHLTKQRTNCTDQNGKLAIPLAKWSTNLFIRF